MNEKELAEIDQKLEKIKIHENKKHIFLCAGPKCCANEVGEEVWEHLKGRLREPEFKGVARTKAACLRVCRQGPVALVYPEGIWYAQVDKQTCDRILDEHILGDRPVEEKIIATKKLE